MYTKHFGLLEAPFSITPDPQYLYMSDRHREALAHLVYGIGGGGGGFVVLTGEVGTGKTTICRCLLKQLPADVDVALVLNPKLTAVELLATVCDDLGLRYAPETTSLKVLVDTLYRYVLDAHERGRRTVLIIDEAQNLSAEVLEQVRLLTNLETTKEKLLLVILIGQPELNTALQQPELRQLSQRVTARYHLEPLGPHETEAYIAHRLEVAGVRKTIFRTSAIREIHRLSKGVPRLINVMCDRALLGAYAGDQRTIDVATIRKAGREVLGSGTRVTRRRVAVAVAVAVALAAAVVSAVAWARGDVAGRGRTGPVRPVSAAAPPGMTATGAAGTPKVDPSPPVPPLSTQRLRDVLADPTISADKTSAFRALYARWGIDERRGASAIGCADARTHGLHCLLKTGTWWSKVRRLDVPAIVQLRTASGDVRYASVVAATDETVTLAFGTRELTFPLGELDPAWDGSFIALWKRPPLGPGAVVPGAKGSDVVWLRKRLDEIDGTSAPTRPDARDTYDGELQKRVAAFQRRRALPPDAIVGEETLAHLSLGSDRHPSLTRQP